MNSSKKVVFLGAKEIGLECLKLLNEKQKYLNYEVVGVLTNKKGLNISEYAAEFSLPVLNSLEDFLELEHVDIAISVQYHEILKKKHIDKAEDLFVNLHMAPLPEYRGCNQFSFAIIEEREEFGTTIHLLDEGIDSGDILFEDRFKIPCGCWISELYELTANRSIKLFERSLASLVALEITPISQSSYASQRSCSLHYRYEIETLKQLDLSWDKAKIERHIRGTYMPGFEPPYFLIGDNNVYVQVDKC